jgi:Flp pilus assembly protein TadD
MQFAPDDVPNSCPSESAGQAPAAARAEDVLRQACFHFDHGEFDQAVVAYQQVIACNSAQLAAQACNDLAVLDCVRGNTGDARDKLLRALQLDSNNEAARANLALFDADPAIARRPEPVNGQNQVADSAAVVDVPETTNESQSCWTI